jgi:uridine monophosphate synthetase
VYVDLRLLVSDPGLLADVAQAYARVMSTLRYDRIAAIPYAGLPIGTAVALAVGRPMIFPRKEAKAHGTKKTIEGHFEPGETAVVLDDLISSGGSKLEAIEPLEQAGLVVRDVVVLIDREGGGDEELTSAGYQLISVLTLSQIARQLAEDGSVSDAQAQSVLEYVAAQRRT